jgi:hypothetical protein
MNFEFPKGGTLTRETDLNKMILKEVKEYPRFTVFYYADIFGVVRHKAYQLKKVA